MDEFRKSLHRFGPCRFVADERGAAMLEFVLVAPVLTYLFVAILFIRNHLDYAQDQIAHTRATTWANVLPANVESASGSQSDADKFFTIPLRPALIAGGIMGALDASVGAGVAGLRYTNNFSGVPYDTLELPRNNYMDTHVTPLDMVEEPWGEILGNLGKFFGESIGTGTYQNFEGLSPSSGGWRDRFPQSVNPWMRRYNFHLDAFEYPLINLAMFELAGATGFMTTDWGRFMQGESFSKFDNRDDVDIGRDEMDFAYFFSDSEPELQLTTISGNRVEDIID